MNVRIALDALWLHRRRNVLSFLGLVVGIATVVAILGLTVIVRREALQQFDHSGLDLLAIRKTGATAGSAPAAFDLTLADVLPAAIPALEQVAPVMERRVSLTLRGRTFAVDALGVTPAFLEFNNLRVAAGRALFELDRLQYHIVLGRDQARALQAPGETASLVGTEVLVEGRVCTIVGVLDHARAVKLHAGDLNQGLLLPAAVLARIAVPAEITAVYARTRAGTTPRLVAAEITDYFRQRHDGLGVQVTSAEQLVAEMEHQLRLFAIFLGAAGTLALLLGGAATTNSLLLAVAQRRREIGLRRALGAMSSDIRTQFLTEAVVLCGGGGIVGLALGLGVTAAIAQFTGWGFVVAPAVPLLGLAVAIVIGVAVGFYPAWQAARLDPVSALKPEG